MIHIDQFLSSIYFIDFYGRMEEPVSVIANIVA